MILYQYAVKYKLNSFVGGEKPQKKTTRKQTYLAPFPPVISYHAFSAHFPLLCQFSSATQPHNSSSLRRAPHSKLYTHTLLEYWSLGPFLQTLHSCNIYLHTQVHLCFSIPPEQDQLAEITLSPRDTQHTCEYRDHIRYQFHQTSCTCEKQGYSSERKWQ